MGVAKEARLALTGALTARNFSVTLLSENPMYTKPKLIRFGTFRELTLIGFGSDGDGFIIGRLDGPQGCGPLERWCNDTRS